MKVNSPAQQSFSMDKRHKNGAPIEYSTVVSALDALRNVQDNQRYELEIRTTVKRFVDERCAAHLQNVLQSKIKEIKGLESEIAAIRKKRIAIEKDVDALQTSISRVTNMTTDTKNLCSALQNTLNQQNALTEKAKKNIAEHCSRVKEKVEEKVMQIYDSCEQRKESIGAIVDENRRLSEEVAKEKAAFDSAYAAHQEGLKSGESRLKGLMSAYKETMESVREIETKIALVRQERRAINKAKDLLRSQNENYESKFGHILPTFSLEGSEKMMEQQRKEFEETIERLKSEKSEANTLRLQYEKELTRHRTAVAAAKRKLTEAEKDRMLAERKCRQAQEQRRAKAGG